MPRAAVQRRVRGHRSGSSPTTKPRATGSHAPIAEGTPCPRATEPQPADATAARDRLRAIISTGDRFSHLHRRAVLSPCSGFSFGAPGREEPRPRLFGLRRRRRTPSRTPHNFEGGDWRTSVATAFRTRTPVLSGSVRSPGGNRDRRSPRCPPTPRRFIRTSPQTDRQNRPDDLRRAVLGRVRSQRTSDVVASPRLPRGDRSCRRRFHRWDPGLGAVVLHRDGRAPPDP